MKLPDIRPACATNQLSRGEAQGQSPPSLWRLTKTTSIYVLTKEDVDGVAKTIGLSKLTHEHYRMAQKYIQSFCGDGAYSWENAISDALKDADEELRGGDSGPKPEE